MKNLIFITLTTLVLSANLYSQRFFVGGEASYLMPLGTLGDRYNPGNGFSLIAGEVTKEAWNWSGRFEYFRFGESNPDHMKVKRRLTVAGAQKDYDIALKSLTMEMNVYGLSANLNYDFVDLGFVRGQASLGFGVYRWENLRSEVKDTLSADTSGTGAQVFVEYLQVPENKQFDWSGGFYAGLKIDVPVYDPVSINFSGHYKGVIGELWPALALNQENVSVFQMLELKLGIKVKL